MNLKICIDPYHTRKAERWIITNQISNKWARYDILLTDIVSEEVKNFA